MRFVLRNHPLHFIGRCTDDLGAQLLMLKQKVVQGADGMRTQQAFADGNDRCVLLLATQVLNLVDQRFLVSQAGLEVLDNDFACLGQFDPVRPLLDQLDIQLLFELGDVAADRRCRYAQFIRCRTHRALFVADVQVLQAAVLKGQVVMGIGRHV
ncbi:hypothetical protein D3C77_428090 [compost metagenome]